jgi:GNAT superfamily N-acetyltransferase
MAKKKMNAFVKTPSECSLAELDTFQKLVVEGGEVTPHGLRQRIEQAAALVFVNDSQCCVAVGAIKMPNQSYKEGVFAKAGVADKSNDFNYELGWLYVTPPARGKGVGHNLMHAITSYLGNSSCYATTRENNDPMHHLFSQYNFSRYGKAYQSNNGYYLGLFANKP